MRPLLLALAAAAALSAAVPASAVPPCSQVPCVYTYDANVCVHEQPSTEVWRTTCAGADGFESCRYSYGSDFCTRLPGDE
ncbi:MAG TPA: hypothetical protein VGX28_10255 [Frankiaceae bacterium]|jgi:hypothetical protein|nr:hypothetical protein [Frankiaceae bacterium]